MRWRLIFSFSWICFRKNEFSWQLNSKKCRKSQDMCRTSFFWRWCANRETNTMRLIKFYETQNRCQKTKWWKNRRNNVTQCFNSKRKSKCNEKFSQINRIKKKRCVNRKTKKFSCKKHLIIENLTINDFVSQSKCVWKRQQNFFWEIWFQNLESIIFRSFHQKWCIRKLLNRLKWNRSLMHFRKKKSWIRFQSSLNFETKFSEKHM